LTAPITGSLWDPEMPLTGIVVEPSQMREPLTGSIWTPTLPDASMTNGLQEHAQTETPPNS